ncbi:MAG: circularly permuted type 2 ATP-grasp protein [Leptospirillia bacterium]
MLFRSHHNTVGSFESSESLGVVDILPFLSLRSPQKRKGRGGCQGKQKILRDRVIPEEVVLSSAAYRPECRGIEAPGGIWCHITGSDLVRDGSGEFFVLKDNLRCPSGISYVLENRHVLIRTFADSFTTSRICSVDDYPLRLLDALESLAPQTDSPTVVLLSPGVYNSAYFEHSFLARQMGIELVEPADLHVIDGFLTMRTTRGPRRVDVVHRRIDPLSGSTVLLVTILGVRDFARYHSVRANMLFSYVQNRSRGNFCFS